MLSSSSSRKSIHLTRFRMVQAFSEVRSPSLDQFFLHDEQFFIAISYQWVWSSVWSWLLFDEPVERFRVAAFGSILRLRTFLRQPPLLVHSTWPFDLPIEFKVLSAILPSRIISQVRSVPLLFARRQLDPKFCVLSTAPCWCIASFQRFLQHKHK